MSLETPEKIKNLQSKLHQKAKEEPGYRFYLLYDKVYRPDILEFAYRLCRSNDGSSGVDGVTFEQIESWGRAEWLERLRKELQDQTYRPDPVRWVMIPKPGGGERPLGIPTIRDRVVQAAAKRVLEPIFEADFVDEAYGYRPHRSAQDAVKAVHQALKDGYTEVVDADLSQYFDTIPHRELMKSVSRGVVVSREKVYAGVQGGGGDIVTATGDDGGPGGVRPRSEGESVVSLACGAGPARVGGLSGQRPSAAGGGGVGPSAARECPAADGA